ncbi:hypothetical protein QL285_014602 [Trifolium repens]|nr:hypothetical protein QL285_014602 [Trifolium repens]
MASASNTRNNNDQINEHVDFIPTTSSPERHNTVLSPVRQPLPESDPRDGAIHPGIVQALPHNTKEGSPDLPKTVATLEAIFQGPKETLRAYIERFNREAVQVEEPDDMKSRGVKIGAGLPELARKQLKACLRENADLFAWSAAEMPGLDPEVACHQLTVDPNAKYVVQRRRKQSPEKEEAAQKAVKDLLEANFISEARYTT